jgi:hypothetical protein
MPLGHNKIVCYIGMHVFWCCKGLYPCWTKWRMCKYRPRARCTKTEEVPSEQPQLPSGVQEQGCTTRWHTSWISVLGETFCACGTCHCAGIHIVVFWVMALNSHQVGSLSGNVLVLYSGYAWFQSWRVPHGFPQALWVDVRIVPPSGHECLLLNPFQFVIHRSSHHWCCIVGYLSINISGAVCFSG